MCTVHTANVKDEIFEYQMVFTPELHLQSSVNVKIVSQVCENVSQPEMAFPQVMQVERDLMNHQRSSSASQFIAYARGWA